MQPDLHIKYSQILACHEWGAQLRGRGGILDKSPSTNYERTPHIQNRVLIDHLSPMTRIINASILVDSLRNLWLFAADFCLVPLVLVRIQAVSSVCILSEPTHLSAHLILSGGHPRTLPLPKFPALSDRAKL